VRHAARELAERLQTLRPDERLLGRVAFVHLPVEDHQERGDGNGQEYAQSERPRDIAAPVRQQLRLAQGNGDDESRLERAKRGA
jgi:hypothetical protein